MTRKVGAVLHEILTAIEGIERATVGKDFKDFQEDWLLRHGVQRGIEIVSEAVRHLPAELIATRQEIPWQRIRGAGNVLRHEYFRVADRVIWGSRPRRFGCFENSRGSHPEPRH
jgi:uncharacterized protein with HEPN domain